MRNSKNTIKKRNWAFVAYPESLPVDWLQILTETGLQGCVSPLHDKDVNADGEIKKSHYHIILNYSGPTSYNVVLNLTEKLHASIPQPLEQVRGYYRYLTHKDNPEKHQYDEKDIKCFNGFNISDFIELTKSEINTIKRELQKLIDDKELYEYCDFMDYLLLHEEMINEYDVASSNTYFFDRYISSKRNKLKIGNERKS